MYSMKLSSKDNYQDQTRSLRLDQIQPQKQSFDPSMSCNQLPDLHWFLVLSAARSDSKSKSKLQAFNILPCVQTYYYHRLLPLLRTTWTGISNYARFSPKLDSAIKSKAKAKAKAKGQSSSSSWRQSSSYPSTLSLKQNPKTYRAIIKLCNAWLSLQSLSQQLSI